MATFLLLNMPSLMLVYLHSVNVEKDVPDKNATLDIHPVPEIEPKGVVASEKYDCNSTNKSSGPRGRSGNSARRFRGNYESPMNRGFCSSQGDHDTEYEVCIIDCDSYRRGRNCVEKVYEKKCGCKETKRAKRKGVMRYKVSF